MPTQIQWRRGTTAQTASFTGASAEITVDTSKNTLVVHDGVTAGGFPLALESQVANSTFTQSAFDTANTAWLQANSAFAAANNVAPQVQPAYDQANAAFEKANTNPLSPNFPSSPFGFVTDVMYTALGEHISGIIYDMKLVPDANLRIVDAGTLT